MTRHRALAGVVASLLLAGRSEAQTEPLFGSGRVPAVVRNELEVAFDPKDKQWEIPVSLKSGDRLVRVDYQGSADRLKGYLICSSKADLIEGDWAIAQGACHISIESTGREAEGAKIRIYGAARGGVESLPLTPAQEAAATNTMLQVFVTLSPPPTDETTSDALGDQAERTFLRTLVSGPTLLIVAILAVAAAMATIIVVVKKTRSNQIQIATLDVKLRRGHEPATPSASPSRTAAEESRQAPEDKTSAEHAKHILALEHAVDELDRRLNEAADDTVKHLTEARHHMSSARNEDLHRLHQLEGFVQAIEHAVNQRNGQPSSAFQELLTNLPTLAAYFAPATALSADDLKVLEERLIDSIKKAALSSEQLTSLRSKTGNLIDAIGEFTSVATTLSSEHTHRRLRRANDSALVLQSEIANLSQMAAAQKHGFYVEMSLLDNHSLGKDVAAALTRETTKLKSPDLYYEKRLMSVSTQIGVAALDLADLDIDPERKHKALQEGVTTLIARLGLKVIDPRPNENPLASHHQVVQFVRRSESGRAGAIAHTMSRGVECGSDVVRKASVLLFE